MAFDRDKLYTNAEVHINNRHVSFGLRDAIEDRWKFDEAREKMLMIFLCRSTIQESTPAWKSVDFIVRWQMMTRGGVPLTRDLRYRYHIKTNKIHLVKHHEL